MHLLIDPCRMAYLRDFQVANIKGFINKEISALKAGMPEQAIEGHGINPITQFGFFING